MVGTRKLVVEILGDSKGMSAAVNDADGALGKLGHGLGELAKKAAIGFAALGVGAAVFAKSAIEAAQESAKVTAQTEAVIKSTGAAAHVTSKQVADLATSISNKTGIDDEAIQSGQNLLLTFTDLQNRAGKGNDIFNQATQVMVDMSAAMGTDASSTAIQLGKALNDPTKGITALTRVGVTFSAAQKKQIETMQKAGDIAGAQKIILAELTKEFGGSAAAQSTAAARMKVAFGNLQEQIGTMLIPVVEKLSTFLVERVIPAMSKFADNAMPKIQRAFNWLRTNVPPIAAEIARIATDVFKQRLIPAFEEVSQIIMERVWPALKAIFDFLMDHKEILVGIAVAIGVGLVAAFVSWAVAAGAAAAATIIALAPVIAIGVAIAALTAGIIYAYKHWGWFKTAVDAVGDAIAVVFNFIKDHWKLILELMTGPIGIAVIEIVKHWDTIKNTFTGVKDWISEKIGDIVGFFTKLPGRIKDAAVGAFDGLKDAFKESINWIIRGWNSLDFKMPEVDTHIPGVGKIGGWTMGLPDIPELAAGGMVRSSPGGTLVRLGEGGQDEFVIPRNRMGGPTIIVNIAGSAVMQRELVGVLQDALRRGYG